MSWVLVPIVVGEPQKEHVAAQVIEPVLAHLETAGDDRPGPAIVVLIEAARVAASGAVRRRVDRLAARVQGVRVLLWPVVNRLGLRLNARVLAARRRAYHLQMSRLHGALASSFQRSSQINAKFSGHLLAKQGLELVRHDDSLVHKPDDVIIVFRKPLLR